MKNKKRILLVLLSLFSLTSCASDIEIRDNKSSESENTTQRTTELTTVNAENPTDTILTTTKTETPEKNTSPELDEKFYAYPLVHSGTLFATISEPEYYTNIFDANIDTDCFIKDIKDFQQNDSLRFYDEETGEILVEQSVDTPRVFVKVKVTVENVDAISVWQEYEKGLRNIDQMFKDGYCEPYDFSADNFGIGILKESNAYDKSNTTGTGVDYFSLSGQLYSDEYRYLMYDLNPGEKKTFEIGKFMPSVLTNDDYIMTFGGEIGDNLISRYCVVTSYNPHDPIIKLQLQ